VVPGGSHFLGNRQLQREGPWCLRSRVQAQELDREDHGLQLKSTHSLNGPKILFFGFFSFFSCLISSSTPDLFCPFETFLNQYNRTINYYCYYPIISKLSSHIKVVVTKYFSPSFEGDVQNNILYSTYQKS
jgi:hypothetical protein